VAGQTYTVTFFVEDAGGLETFSRLSTNGDVTDAGGNGGDVLLYAGETIPIEGASVPEPATMALLVAGVLGIGATRRRGSRTTS